MKFALIPNMTRENALPVTKSLICECVQNRVFLLMPNLCKEFFGEFSDISYGSLEEIVSECDMIASVGGDGTFINAAKYAAGFNKPLICINAGKLAYLACLEANELSLLKNIVNREYSVEKRMMLDAAIIDKDGNILYHSNCVNDAVVSRSGNIRIMKLSISCNEAPLIQYMGDGVIVATPTGSTAYSLSAGGPVVEPQVESMMITPVCSHGVFSRSIVLRDTSVLDIVHDNTGEVILSCDGTSPVLIPEGATVRVTRSSDTVGFVKVKNDTFIDVLSKKIF